jgi:glutamate racemase
MEAISSQCIGVFDSGVGGLTVLQQLMQVLPSERFIYFGDTARLPYGEKSRETIIRYSIENALFLIEKNIKMLVIACNTASAYALEKLQQMFNIPVIGVIEPGAECAVRSSRGKRIAVLGTKGTISSQIYQKAILKKEINAFVFSLACPLFVSLVEEHYIHYPAARLIVKDYLKPLKEQQIDTLLLGCTHYPLLKHLIQDELGNGIAIVDSAATCAEHVSAILRERGLNNTKSNLPACEYFVSDDPSKFQSLGQKFLGMPINQVELWPKN